MKKTLMILMSLSALQAFANDQGGYAGVNIGLGNVNALKSLDFGLNLNGGYQLNKNFALEGDYTYFSEQQTWASSQLGISPAINGSTMYFIGAAKGILPINNNFDLYGKLGLGYSYSSYTNSAKFLNGSSNAFSPAGLIAAGANFHLNKNLGINLEFANYLSDAENALGNSNLLSIGLSYKF